MRLFIALDVPEHVTLRLTREQERLAALGLPFRWVSRSAMHLTLVFLGDVAEELVPTIGSVIDSAGATTSPLSLGANGVGAFPPRGTPRVVWAGLSGDRSALIALYSLFADGLRARGVRVEERHFAPHVTLGRLGSRASRADLERVRHVEQYCALEREFGAWTARDVRLIRSELGPEEARYTTLYTSPLKG